MLMKRSGDSRDYSPRRSGAKKSRGGDQNRDKDRDRDHDRSRDKDRDRSRDKDRDRDRVRDKDRDRDRGKDRDRDRDQDRASSLRSSDRDKERDQDRDKDRHRGHDRDQDRDKDRHRDHSRDQDRDKDRHRDHSRDQDRDKDRHRDQEQPPYKALCARDIDSRAEDELVRQQMREEFDRFGLVKVTPSHFDGEKIAFLYFDRPEDARRALANKLEAGGLTVNGRPCHLDPHYSRKKSPPRQRQRHSPSQPPLPPIGSSAAGRRRGGDYGGRRGPPPEDVLPPEDDDRATRTLFLGNMPPDVDEHLIRHKFERFGIIQDLEVKRPPKSVMQTPGAKAFAFIKFLTLDMAHKARVHLSQSSIGGHIAKIGYAKAVPSPCLWLGGLGSWLSEEKLRAECERFGPLERLDWPPGREFAFVLFERQESAVEAVRRLRGASFYGEDKRLRTDFADANIDMLLGLLARHAKPADMQQPQGPLTSAPFLSANVGSGMAQPSVLQPPPLPPPPPPPPIDKASSIGDVVRNLQPACWAGALLLKGVRFSASLHYFYGENRLLRDHFPPRDPLAPRRDYRRAGSRDRDSDHRPSVLREPPQLPAADASDQPLEIRQRVRITPASADRMLARLLASAEGFCVCVCVPKSGPTAAAAAAAAVAAAEEASVTASGDSAGEAAAAAAAAVKVAADIRPFKHLLSYLVAKDSVGVVHLEDDMASLYLFPPCLLTQRLFTKKAPLLDWQRTGAEADEHLLGLLLRRRNPPPQAVPAVPPYATLMSLPMLPSEAAAAAAANSEQN